MGNVTPEQKLEVGKFFEAMGILAATAGKAYSDKKIDMMDIPHLMSLAANSGKILDGFDDMDVVWAAMEQMDVSEIISTLRDAYNVGLKYENARKS